MLAHASRTDEIPFRSELRVLEPANPIRTPGVLEAVRAALSSSERSAIDEPVACACEAMGVVGKSKAIRNAFATVLRAAATPRTTVLIEGASGTGKELIARTLHATSARARGPFVAVNCAALPDALLESELFGHERGAFSGAVARKQGLFEAAHKGTLLLDEIGEMGLGLQAKLLRVLQEQSIRRVGGIDPLVDVRVVASTNRDLAALVAEGRFRADLYYRLNVVRVEVPVLASRRADVLPIARSFLRTFALELGRPLKGFSKSAAAALLAHDWPGNVRELRNVVERAAILAPGMLVRAADLGLETPKKPAALEQAPPSDKLEEVERAHLLRVLERCRGNQSRAAAELGIHRTTLAKKVRDYGIDRAPISA